MCRSVPKCGSGPVEKLASSPAIQFKGAGFYITDYARKDQDKGKDRGEKSEKRREGRAEQGLVGVLEGVGQRVGFLVEVGQLLQERLLVVVGLERIVIEHDKHAQQLVVQFLDAAVQHAGKP